MCHNNLRTFNKKISRQCRITEHFCLPASMFLFSPICLLIYISKYHGNVSNNYVSFAGLTWKIIRINEDGTIRLILTNRINGTNYSFNSTENNGNVSTNLEFFFQSSLCSLPL